MEAVFLIIFFVFIIFDASLTEKRKSSCGVDNSNVSTVYEGGGDIDTYPWMGVLYYDIHKTRSRTSTSVILITKQIVLGSAEEIDKLPKEDFRTRSRVILGQKCLGPGIRVRDYTFHPDYRRNNHGALAMVQLDVDRVQTELRPICPPPKYFVAPTFYAMTLSKDCYKGKMRIYKMMYANTNECAQFYRKSGLKVDMLWPTDAVCVRALSGGRCLWRSGTALVVKQGRRWRLLGFGLYGPGCQAPSRFLDYGKYHEWVWNSIARIGRPAITRLSQSEIIMRRSLANVQRFGPCDPEETDYEMYTDRVDLAYDRLHHRRSFIYNVSLYHDVEYSCIVFRAESVENVALIGRENPRIHLRRWCAGPPKMCYGFQYIEINFFVEIEFYYGTSFSMAAYGKKAKIISPKKAMTYVNKEKKPVEISSYRAIVLKLVQDKGKYHRKKHSNNKWFYSNDITRNSNPYWDQDVLFDEELAAFYWFGGVPFKLYKTYTVSKYPYVDRYGDP